MEPYVLKLCSSILRLRCVLSTTHLRVSQTIYRSKHLAVKEKLDEELPAKLSTLYVPGRYGGNMYQIVKPRIDVNLIEKNFADIERSCRLRGIELEKDNFLPLLKEWETLRTALSIIIAEDSEYNEEKKRLTSLNLTSELESLAEKQNACIDKLKEIKNKVHDIEDIVIPLVKNIPNYVKVSVPIETDIVEDIIGTFDNMPTTSHAEIGKTIGMLEFSNVSPTAYYMKGKFSDLELQAQEYFFDKLVEQGYWPMSCTDFCKSFIIEAIGLDPYSYDHCIPLKPKDKRDVGQRLNLVGGASFASFCAYLVNMNVAETTLPMKYFSLGRCYNARNRSVSSPDLFSTVQSSNIQLLVLSRHDEDSEFDDLFNTLVSMYRALGMPFRTVNVSVKNLNATESRKKIIELWSPSRQGFVPISWLTSRGDFVSRRLNVSFGEECHIHGYCSMVEGVAVNIPVLIGCIVENFQSNNQTFDFPGFVKS